MTETAIKNQGLECPICGKRQVDENSGGFKCWACHRNFLPDQFKCLARLKVKAGEESAK